jgi:polar amino acid transport system substrate-binding protein
MKQTTPLRNAARKGLAAIGFSLLKAGEALFSLIAPTFAADKKSDDLRMAGFHGMDTSILRGSATLRLALVLVPVLALGCPSLVQAQNAASEFRVATVIAAPFVLKAGDQLTGFSIDIWEAVAARLNVRSSYTIADDKQSRIALLQSGKADIGVSGIYYSTELDTVIDFTYPILNAGLRIMVRDQDADNGAQFRPLRDWLTLLFSRASALWLLAALLMALIPAHVVWLLDRANEDGVSPSKKYFPGIFHSMYWAMTAVAAQAPLMPRQWIARILGVIWLFAGVVFISLFTAQLTALLTIEQIHGAIHGPGDLPGKRVGTVLGSTSATYLQKIRADVKEFPSQDEMYNALLEKQVDAVVLHAPVLNYYAAHEGLGRVKLVGPEFEKRDIGFVVPLGSPLRKRVSKELLALYEDGTYDRIYAKWFGSE